MGTDPKCVSIFSKEGNSLRATTHLRRFAAPNYPRFGDRRKCCSSGLSREPTAHKGESCRSLPDREAAPSLRDRNQNFPQRTNERLHIGQPNLPPFDGRSVHACGDTLFRERRHDSAHMSRRCALSPAASKQPIRGFEDICNIPIDSRKSKRTPALCAAQTNGNMLMYPSNHFTEVARHTDNNRPLLIKSNHSQSPRWHVRFC